MSAFGGKADIAFVLNSMLDRAANRGDVYVHISEIDGEEPCIGDRVTYEIGADRRPGLRQDFARKLCAS